MLRKATKSLLYGIGFVLTAPLWLPERTARCLFGRDFWFVAQSQLVSLFPGTGGVLLRNAYYRMVLASCPLHVCFQFGSLPSYSDIHVGKEVYIGLHCKLGLADIGDGSILSDDVHVLSGSRQHSSAGYRQAFHLQPTHRQRVSIGRNCWIGAHAVVMADIGDNCIIGAGAVVTEPVPANSVAVGIPARVIRSTSPPQWMEDGPELACAGMESKS